MKRSVLGFLNAFVLPIISFFATLILTVVSTFVVKLDDKGTFIVFSTGITVSLGIALIEQRLQSESSNIKQWIIEELGKRFDIFRMIQEIDDEQLQQEVFLLAHRLSTGEVPTHITSVRVPVLYNNSKNNVYASNISLTREDLLRWSSNARFKQIVETSRIRSQNGVKFTRTFVLSHAQTINNGSNSWNEECKAVIQTQVDAGIEVRIIWIEDLHIDHIAPTRRIDRNFTIFDDTEAIDATNHQIIYRPPSKRVQDFIDLRQEQIKYSHKYIDIVK
ncbi:hypothetical protein [Desulforegula conservatrix]|uniref:hypothetical protein n=1 Tax=Desulforegula conservatrix TaxID=153026 RepID=UPI0003FADF60|nr:hypothetical protein [Desulforegula conservatrix]